METKSSEQASPERKIPFEDLERNVKAYLSDPKSGDPYSDVNDYFGGISDPKEVVGKTQSLLFDTRHKLLHPQPSDLDPRYGNPGTIVMRLPYFYPLHLTLFSWYVDGSLKTAEGLSDQDKEKLVTKISEDAVIYGLIPDEVKRVKERLNNFFPLSRGDKALILSSERLSPPWYKKLNPFKGK